MLLHFLPNSIEAIKPSLDRGHEYDDKNNFERWTLKQN